MSDRTVVFVALPDEGVDVWRPVAAEHLGGELYRLIDSPPDDEQWEFATGSVVRCHMRRLSGDGGKLNDVLVAYEELN